MSNILIIKHGSLGDLIQANGAMEDISSSFKDSKVFLLTSRPYVEFMSECPYIDGVILDKRLPRWNFFYLLNLKKQLSRYAFTHVFDLQNSKRTKFYENYLIPKPIWSSTETALERGEKKSDFDQDPVLDRIKIQLKKSGIKTKNVNNSNLNWAFTNIRHITKNYISRKYILLFPFCSQKLINKKWPYYSILVSQLKSKYGGKYDIAIAPGPNEIEESRMLSTNVILDGENPLKLNQLISLIKGASFIISNDTGPAHICRHLDKPGIVLFGSHTTPQKVSIESKNFKAITSSDLKLLQTETVMEKVKEKLN